jgi:uncharacterized protein (UPF0305 family)
LDAIDKDEELIKANARSADDAFKIEDTSDWVDSPTRLETIKHYASMLEEDVQDLKRQLQEAKENISSVVEMNDRLSAKLKKKRA